MSENKSGDLVVDALMKRFVNRNDTYGEQKEDGSYRRVDEPLTKEVIKRHQMGDITIGCYQLNSTNNSVKWICFDVDPEKTEKPAKVALKIFEQAKKSFGDKAVFLEASRFSDQSYHIWIFFEPQIPASVARFEGKTILKNLHLETLDVELFPKQEKITQKGFGNLVKMPLGVHRKHNKRSQFLNAEFEKLPNACILDVQPHKMRDVNIKRILEQIKNAYKKDKNKKETEQGPRFKKEDPECIKNLMKGVKKGIRNEVAIHLASYWLNFCKMKRSKAWDRLESWNTKNQPPLDEKELLSIMESAEKGGYNYGCSNPFLKRLCPGRKKCTLFDYATKISHGDLNILLEKREPNWQIQFYKNRHRMSARLPFKFPTDLYWKPQFGSLRKQIDQEHGEDAIGVRSDIVEKLRRECEKWNGNRKKGKQEKGIRYKPFVELSNRVLCEQAFDGRKTFYLVYNDRTGEVTWAPEVEDEHFIYKPIDNDEVKNRLVQLPSNYQDFKNEEQLMKDIRGFLNRWHEPVDQESRTLDVLYILLTYIKDLVPQLPYRRILASYGRGKSAWLDSLGSIAYRGLILAGSDTDKSFVRRMDNWQGTALIDEADFGDSSFYSFITKILNVGYDQRTGYYQRCDENDPNKTLSYSVYGPKILATRGKYKDPALESRCLTTIGRQNIRPMPLFRMKRFKEEAQILRNKSIYWRFKNYYRMKEAAKQLEDPTIANVVYGKDSKISSRIKQVILPLWIVGGDQMKATLVELAKHLDERLKAEDPDYLLELQVKEALIKLVEGDEYRNIVNVVTVEGTPKENQYQISLSSISQKLLEQQGFSEEKITRKEKISMSKKLKRIFQSNLGFNIRIGQAKTRVVSIPEIWLKPSIEEPTLPIEHSKDSDIHQQKTNNGNTLECVHCHRPILPGKARATDPETHKDCHMSCYRRMEKRLEISRGD